MLVVGQHPALSLNVLDRFEDHQRHRIAELTHRFDDQIRLLLSQCIGHPQRETL